MLTIFFLRVFSFNNYQTDEDDDAQLLDNASAAIASDDVDIIIRPNNNESQINGNNILNSNLSGSFREENEIGRVIPQRSSSSAPNILQRSDEEEPSTSAVSPRRLGIAAIPNSNIQFLSSQRHHDSISRE